MFIGWNVWRHHGINPDGQMAALHVVSTYSASTCSHRSPPPPSPLCRQPHLTHFQPLWIAFDGSCPFISFPLHSALILISLLAQNAVESFPLTFCFYCRTHPIVNQVSGTWSSLCASHDDKAASTDSMFRYSLIELNAQIFILSHQNSVLVPFFLQ